jgi:chemotaxis response regulator CheB
VTGVPIITLVYSAGGLDALTRVLESLPAAVLALQHLSPQHHSELAVLLDQRTALPVTTATDGAPLIAGAVLVTPYGSTSSSPPATPSR